MSRSNPTTNNTHVCTRWHEWGGSDGVVKYYDKTAGKNIEVADGFTFIVLDQLATIKGWHDASDSGIHSNEVRDTRAEPFIVKSFKGGQIAEGFYAQIRDKVNAMGGNYVTNVYIAYRKDGELAIGSIQFKGAALNSWVEFTKANREAINTKAVKISGYTEGKKGKIVFRTPNFKVSEITEEANEQAIALDEELQEYLKGYFSKPTTQRTTHEQEPAESTGIPDDPAEAAPTDPDETDPPF